MDIKAERYAELVIAENNYNRLCEVIRDKSYRGLTPDEMRFLRDLFCPKQDPVREV